MKKTTISFDGREVRVAVVPSLGGVHVTVRNDLVIVADCGDEAANLAIAEEAIRWLRERQ